MRTFEIILLILISILPFYLSIKKDPVNKRISLSILGGLLILHLIIEGYRWQMIPAYLTLLILAWCVFKEYSLFKGGWFRKIVSGFALFILLFLAWILPYLLPVFNLPELTGKYKVGAQDIKLVTSLDEPITPEIGDKRELMVKVWYPAHINNEEKEVYLNEAERVGFAFKYGLPKSTFNYLDAVETHTYIKPAVEEGKFPVLIFSHGQYSNATGYYSIIEEIVSHGYIVLNLNHTFESVGTLFPNGEIKLYDRAWEEKIITPEMGKIAWDLDQGYKKASTFEEKFKASEKGILNYVAADITVRWSKDISALIDELTKWNTSSFLANHMNISEIGVFGHSQGGSAAGQALLDDNRIKAGVNIDGIQWGPMIDTLLTKPFTYLASDWPSTHADLNAIVFRNGTLSDFYKAKIPNSGHANFMDIPLMINIPVINEAGSIAPNTAYAITTDYVVSFFDKYLLNKPVDLMELKNKHPTLELTQEN